MRRRGCLAPHAPLPLGVVDHDVDGAVEEQAFVGLGGLMGDQDDLLGQIAGFQGQSDVRSAAADVVYVG